MNRLFRALALSLVLSTALAPMAVVAQDVPTAVGATFAFGAPCEDRRAGTGSFAGQLPPPNGAGGPPPCVPFTVNGLVYQTPETPLGNPARVNLYLNNPAKMAINAVDMWLAYDPEALTGSILMVSPDFPQVTTEQTGFFPADGYIKLSVKSGPTAPSTEQILIASIELRPLEAKSPSTAVSIFGAGTGADAKTKVTSTSSGTQTILEVEQPSLLVRIAAPSSSSSSVSSSSASTIASSSSSTPSASGSTLSTSSTSSASSSVASVSSSSSSTSLASRPPLSSSSAPMVGATDFRRMQVQGLAIGTQNGSATLSWLPLAEPGVAGYHLYYSSVTGVYTQRRTLEASARGDVVTGLPNGERYFFAIRAFNAAGMESDYSREVAVVIGQPNTATSPLTGSVTGGNGNPTSTPPATNQPMPNLPQGTTVAGKTGVSDLFNGLIAIAAAVGMWGAFRRQLSSTPVTA